MNHFADTIFEVEALSCRRGSRLIFANLDFKLTAGSLLNVVGQNGSGKTSLLRILCGLSEPESGVLRGGYSSSQFAFVGHHLSMKNTLSIRDNLSFWRDLQGSDTGAPITGILKQLNLLHLEHQSFQSLSAGQKRRTCLALLLLRPKPIWLLDEPFTSLDRHGVDLVERLITDQLQAGGIVVMTSHQPIHLNWHAQQSVQLGT